MPATMTSAGRAPEGEPPIPLGASRQYCEDLAAHVRAKLEFTSGNGLESIITKLGGQLQYKSMWEQGPESGSIEIRRVADFTIYLSDATSPRRDRFTIAHELGHYFLHFARQKDDLARDGKIMVAQRYALGPAETEANWFAAGFLMPEAEFKQIWEQTGGDPWGAAAKFQVSSHAAMIRAKSLGLTT